MHRAYATFIKKPEYHDGREFFMGALWHNETAVDKGERRQQGWFISDGPDHAQGYFVDHDGEVQRVGDCGPGILHNSVKEGDDTVIVVTHDGEETGRFTHYRTRIDLLRVLLQEPASDWTGLKEWLLSMADKHDDSPARNVPEIKAHVLQLRAWARNLP